MRKFAIFRKFSGVTEIPCSQTQDMGRVNRFTDHFFLFMFFGLRPMELIKAILQVYYQKISNVCYSTCEFFFLEGWGGGR